MPYLVHQLMFFSSKKMLDPWLEGGPTHGFRILLLQNFSFFRFITIAYSSLL